MAVGAPAELRGNLDFPKPLKSCIIGKSYKNAGKKKEDFSALGNNNFLDKDEKRKITRKISQTGGILFCKPTFFTL